MMGTSLLAVAWAIFNSGLAMGIAIMVLMTIISGHTAHIIISTHAKHHSKIFLNTLLTRVDMQCHEDLLVVLVVLLLLENLLKILLYSLKFHYL
jgi:ammonia channel protein AmtB